MKILHFIPTFPITSKGTVIGGSASSLINIAKSQAKENLVNITSYFPANFPGESEFDQKLTFCPLQVRSRPISKQFGFEFIVRSLIWAKNNQGKFDIIHGHSGHIDYILPFVLISKLLKIPLVYSVNCPVEFSSRITKYPGRKKLITILTKQVDRFIAISNNIDRSMKSVGIQKEKIIVIPPAVDVHKYSFRHDFEGSKQSLNVSPNTPIFLFVGNHAPAKNLETVLIALKKVVEKLPDAILIITTELKLKRDENRVVYLTQLINELQLQKNIIQMGMIDNMADVMASADILIAPFRTTDGPSDFFIAALEAMSVGRPVIVSAVGGMPEVVDDRVGILVSPENAEQLAEAMISLAVNKEHRIELGKFASNRINSKFDPEIVSRAIYSCYKDVVKNAG